MSGCITTDILLSSHSELVDSETGKKKALQNDEMNWNKKKTPIKPI
jgi:hypothetical protein